MNAHYAETVRDYRTKKNQETTVKVTTNVQPTWTTRVINSSQLKSKQDYQRKIDMKFIAKNIANFDPNVVDSIHVSYRDRKFYVMKWQLHHMRVEMKFLVKLP